MKHHRGWAGRVLLVDLVSCATEDMDVDRYLDQYVGGRGLGAALAWEMLRPGMAPFDLASPLMFLNGPLAGTSAPSAGRSTVCALAPQSHPVQWFSRGSMGGDLGHAMKWAGYDGIVLVGRSDRPCYLWLHAGGAELCDAGDLWGRGVMATQRLLRERHGRKAQIATIGPAGENLSRIATISTNEGSAVGQGGFGAVMGSKNLKAVVVLGEGHVAVADQEGFRAFARTVGGEFVRDMRNRDSLRPPRAPAHGARRVHCGTGCVRGCAMRYEGIDGTLFPDRNYDGVVQCTSNRFRGAEGHYWNIGFEAGFELNMLANDWGINHWDLMKGLFPWIGMCHEEGMLNDLGGRPIELNAPRFWYDVLNAIATRQGPLAPIVADGGWQAIVRTGLLPDKARQLYTAWGYANHWDGRGPRGNRITYPFWLVSALLWMTETRDPMGSTHGYVQEMTHASPLDQGVLSWDQLRGIADRVYGNADAADPYSHYEGKAEAANWHSKRSMLKDSLPLCDRVFPRLFSSLTEDGMPLVDGVIGPDFEARLYSLATGHEVDTKGLELAAARALTLERAQQIRDFGRTADMDRKILNFFCDTDEEYVNPLLGKRFRAEREPLSRLASEFYRKRGWDPQSGRPTREHLTSIGLELIADTIAAPPAQPCSKNDRDYV